MSDSVNILVLSPSDDIDRRRGLVPGGIFLRTENALQIVPENMILVTEVSTRFVQIFERTDWVVINRRPAWVYALTTSFPCLGIVLSAGEYSARWEEGIGKYVLLRQTTYLPLPDVVVATPTLRPGYWRKLRADAVPSLLPPHEQGTREYLAQLFGTDRVYMHGSAATVVWHDTYGNSITTHLRWLGDRWEVESVGVCVGGNDRLVPVSAVRAVVEQYSHQGGAGHISTIVVR